MDRPAPPPAQRTIFSLSSRRRSRSDDARSRSITARSRSTARSRRDADARLEAVAGEADASAFRPVACEAGGEKGGVKGGKEGGTCEAGGARRGGRVCKKGGERGREVRGEGRGRT